MIDSMRPTLTSLQNPQVKNLVKLRQRRQRDKQSLFLIDGIRALTLAINSAYEISTLFFDETRPNPTLITAAQSADLNLQPVSPAVFQKIGYGDNPDGHLGLAVQADLSLQQLSLPDPAQREQPLFVVAEGLEKPGNLGAILRSADAAGITGLIVCNSKTDIYNPNVIRASRGTFFTVPLAITDTSILVQWLHENHIHILAATPVGTQLYTDADLRGPVALAVGSEHAGLTDSWMNESSIYIPMRGQSDSLNVAQSATLLMFEAIRQRLRS